MNRAPELLIGIDSSTQSTKACAWTTEGRRVTEGASPQRVDSPRPGWAEQDPRLWWRSTRAALRKALADVNPRRIAALGLAWQRETFALADERGRFVRPAILWLDVRADQEVRQLEREIGRDAYHQETGKPLDVTSALARLVWLKQHEPGALERAARWVDVGGELAYRLTGRYATCSAGADTCGLVSLKRRRWVEPYLERAGLAPNQLPDLVEAGEVVGRVSRKAARETGLPEGLPVVAAGGDGHVFSLGMGATRPGEETLTLGTSIVLGLKSREAHLSPLFRTLIAPGGGYLLECVLQSGTYLLRWFADRFAGRGRQGEAYWDREAARIPPGAEGLVTLPHWWGVRFPEPLPDARGVTLGWSNHHTRAHFYRSLLEGATMEVRRFDRQLRRRLEAGRIGRTLRLGGGGAEGPVWPQLLADALDRPVVRGREREATSLGAAVLAGVGEGVFRSVRAACRAMVRMEEPLRPDRGRAGFYDRLYKEVYAPLLPATADLSAALRRLSSDGPGGRP